ncbi:uroporphyrinogen-III synthase [Bradyrhizobium sp. LHD-71]|uniref:uroporphyrinogen-III synthase n=1 Tax=Bradyrhizobium sp. LHD-71 TaxID=3072141 RepID=UPI00280FAE39|nr:uroporphyrinogen-III synthase [Bradyrhizobium sp. LHD-71]MDQ8729679.1 uroporphyrinogen-III synthase [Bradyrhizobium sp. LHD-71]
MAVLVTRPAPDNQATADALRARGLEPMLAPMLTFQPLPFRSDNDERYSGVILTSANVIRAIVAHPLLQHLQTLPAFAVGARTAQAARDAGFRKVRSAEGDAAALRELIVAHGLPRKRAALLYLAAADVSRDLVSELGLRGVEVASIPVYRMAELDEFAEPVRTAFAHDAIEAVLHYSRRSATAFVKAVRRGGLEVSALALPQLCLSAQIADVLRDAGAHRLIVARAPNEADLLAALEEVLRPRQ